MSMLLLGYSAKVIQSFLAIKIILLGKAYREMAKLAVLLYVIDCQGQ